MLQYLKGFKQYLLLEKNYSENTITSYSNDIKKAANFFNNKSNIDSSDIESLLKHLNSKNTSSRTQARLLSSLTTFFKYLIYEKVLTVNPLETIDRPKLEQKLPIYLSIEEVELMQSNINIKSVMGVRLNAMIELLFGTGLRISEMLNLKITDISEENQWILVTGKGNKQRLVPVGQSALDAISAYYELFRNHIKIEKADEKMVFVNQRGKKISRIFVFKEIKKLAILSGISKNISPHKLRHSFATDLISNGADLRSIQQMLGHSSITTTEVYTHLNKKHLKDLINQFHPRSK